MQRIKNPEISVLGGVLAGVALQIKKPVLAVRIAFIVLLLFFNVLSVLAYLGCWFFFKPVTLSKAEFKRITEGGEIEHIGTVKDIEYKEINRTDKE